MVPYLWEYRGRALFALSCLILAKVANVGIPLVLKDIVDYLQNTDVAQLVLPMSLLLAYGALRLSSSLFNEMRDAVFARVRYHAMRSLSTRVLTHLHNLSLRYHLDRETGAISRDIERGTRSVSSIMNYMVFSIIPMLVEFSLVAMVLLSNYDISFTLITFGTVGIYITFTLAVTEWRMEYRHSMNREESQANSYAFDSLINYETVKYFGNESKEVQRFDDTLENWEGYAVKSQTSMSLLNFGQGSIIALGVMLIMVNATQGVVDGNMSIGDLVLVNAFMLQLFIPLNFLGIVYRQIKYSLADMDRIFKLLETKPEIQDAKDAHELVVKTSEICFDQVDFAYQPERAILKKISFRLKEGEKVAIVGRSGAGKSTLSRLLFRFYDVNSGSVSIDGQDVRELTQESLRRAIGIVPQDSVLFNESIYYNLAYGRDNLTKDEVVAAAKMAHIDAFVDSLPDGYDTVVGERGLKLSGGEKQRVAIARAILKNPRILVFDEATSSLDTKTEQAIQITLKEVSLQFTTLVIAHRLSTVIDADRILVMDQGQIIEQGTHVELMSEEGVYFDMWMLQQETKEKEKLD